MKTETRSTYWLMKSEPSTFSIDDLAHAKNQTTQWEGVRNYQARNFMKNEMKKGDLAFFYHSSCPEPAIVGIVEIVKESYPDPTALDPQSDYYDPKSQSSTPRWFVVDVKLKKKLETPILLRQIKQNPTLQTMRLVQPGNRLSITPVSKKEWENILAMLE